MNSQNHVITKIISFQFKLTVYVLEVNRFFIILRKYNNCMDDFRSGMDDDSTTCI